MKIRHLTLWLLLVIVAGGSSRLVASPALVTGAAGVKVPQNRSEPLFETYQTARKSRCGLYVYPSDNYSITANFAVAMVRTVAFFDVDVKGQQGIRG